MLHKDKLPEKDKLRLVHGYFSIDLEIVWQTVKKDLPQLLKQLEEIIETKNSKKTSLKP